MWAIVAIRAAIGWLFQIFLDAALWCYDSPLNLDWLGDIFADVYFALTDIWHETRELALWFESVEERITDVITESTIFRLLQEWLNYAEDAWYWVRNAFSNVVSIIDAWWDTIIPTIQGWIETATQGFNELKVAWDNFWNVTWPTLIGNVSELRSLWDNFFTITLPSLVSFDWLTTWWNSRLLDVQDLINTAIENITGALEGWQEIRDSVFEFFADPLKWLYDRVEDFMDRYW